jgi:ABC-2 type transport system ATP-binding protein
MLDDSARDSMEIGILSPEFSAPMSQPAISFHDVSKRYGTQEVLRGVSFDVQPGEFFGLVGVNGAGKTTLIKCLLDFTRPDAGRIAISGLTSTETRARSGLAFLPEKFIPPYYLAGRDFLDYMSALHGVSFAKTQIDALLRVLDLVAAALDKPVAQLSKGMAQKLGLLVCLLSSKPLLVMDEPMSGLDPKARAFIRNHLLSLRGSGRTIFFSTHLLHDVESLCDRVAILHDGRIGFVGTPAECCTRFGAESFEQAYLKCVG